MRLFYLFLISILFYNCTGSKILNIAEQNPALLIAMEDSLLHKGRTKSLTSALSLAHNKIGLKEFTKKNYNKALKHYLSSKEFNENNIIANFHILIINGIILAKTGKKDNLWTAIQNYNKASQINPNSGIPHYYIGMAYQKIGDKDFDLILEAFESALALDLEPDLRERTKLAYDKEKSREKALNDFWK